MEQLLCNIAVSYLSRPGQSTGILTGLHFLKLNTMLCIDTMEIQKTGDIHYVYRHILVRHVVRTLHYFLKKSVFS